jgi:hypothetical protein
MCFTLWITLITPKVDVIMLAILITVPLVSIRVGWCSAYHSIGGPIVESVKNYYQTSFVVIVRQTSIDHLKNLDIIPKTKIKILMEILLQNVVQCLTYNILNNQKLGKQAANIVGNVEANDFVK